MKKTMKIFATRKETWCWSWMCGESQARNCLWLNAKWLRKVGMNVKTRVKVTIYKVCVSRKYRKTVDHRLICLVLPRALSHRSDSRMKKKIAITIYRRTRTEIIRMEMELSPHFEKRNKNKNGLKMFWISDVTIDR